jgi:hypothetical protein
MVVWGGSAACGVNVHSDSTLWLWNRQTWRALPGPPLVPREDALLLFAPADSSLTLIGGRRNGVVYSDIWHFGKESWRRLDAEGGPGAIEHGAAAYDPIRKRIVVFGGAADRAMNARTYEWDGTRWHTFDVPGPAPRVGHAMAWSRTDAGVLLYGGFANDQFRDLWKWDGTRWTRLSDQGPTFTEGHVLTEGDSGVHVVGPGLDNSTTVRAWRWHRGAFAPFGDAGPSLRVGAAAVFDRTRRVLIYWGGASESLGPDAMVHELDHRGWRAPPRPGR